MLIEKFEIFLALLAGLALLIMGFIMRFSLPDILLRLLIVLVAFYIVGLIVKTYLSKRIFVKIETEEIIDEETDLNNENDVAVETIEAEENAENQPVL